VLSRKTIIAILKEREKKVTKPIRRHATKRNSKPCPQNVKNAESIRIQKASFPAAPKLVRTTFCTSREMDFFTAKALVAQTGHAIDEWPLVFVKEAIDNALDACEDADTAPIIIVSADASSITVADNGPGLPESTLAAALNFAVRASNREAYVAPCRGAQGNALKTLLPMPGVVDPEHGRLIVVAQGKRHEITCGADPITQQAVVHNNPISARTRGTTIRIEWRPRISDGITFWPFNDLEVLAANSWEHSFAERFRGLVEGFAVFNPHATIRLDWFGDKTEWKATDRSWQKWKPCHPTSPHWYEHRHLERLIGAYITHDRDAGADRLVSDLLQEFDGLSGSQRRAKVLDETGLKRIKLSELGAGGRLDTERIAALLAAMQRHTRPVKAKRLGIIGEKHLKQRLLEIGIKPRSFRYERKLSDRGLPSVLECAFGYRGNGLRRIVAGANWSAAIKNPFRSFGGTGEGLEAMLTDLRAGAHEPIVFVMHLAHPRVEYTDQGKSALVVAQEEGE
jgi:hypothetical protein